MNRINKYLELCEHSFRQANAVENPEERHFKVLKTFNRISHSLAKLANLAGKYDKHDEAYEQLLSEINKIKNKHIGDEIIAGMKSFASSDFRIDFDELLRKPRELTNDEEAILIPMVKQLNKIVRRIEVCAEAKHLALRLQPLLLSEMNSEAASYLNAKYSPN